MRRTASNRICSRPPTARRSSPSPGSGIAGSIPATKEEILSCTIIVSGASEWMTPYHDRMPVLLRAEDFDAWLTGSLGVDALRPATESALREWPVSRRVNRTGIGDDDPTIIERVEVA